MQGAIWVLLTQTLICNDKINDGAYFGHARRTSRRARRPTSATPQGSTGDRLARSCSRPSPASPRTLSRALQARGFIEEVLGAYHVLRQRVQGGGIDQYGSSRRS